MLLAGSSSGDLFVYDIRTSRCVMTYKGHQDAILCIQGRDSKVWTGGDDCTVRQWDLRENRQEHVYTGLSDGVKVQPHCPSLLRRSVSRSCPWPGVQVFAGLFCGFRLLHLLGSNPVGRRATHDG